MLQQLLYISTARPPAGGVIDPDSILIPSRHRNLREGVTGLLFHDGRRFLQVLEGEAAAVTATFARIRQDPRHRAIVTLSRRTIAAREFGAWAMAWQTVGQDGEAALAQLTELSAGADPAVRETFLGFAGLRRAA